MDALKIWYQTPARKFTEALPLGNGRLGMMVYGGTRSDRIQLDESTFWSGAPCEGSNGESKPILYRAVQDALLHKDYGKAEALSQSLVGVKGNYGTNLPVGNLCVTMSCPDTEDTDEAWDRAVTDYQRMLDIRRGIAEERFIVSGHPVARKSFCSRPAQVFFFGCGFFLFY